MSKYAVMVTEPEFIRYHLEKAWYLMSHGRKGPVWLDIPGNVQAAKINVADLADCMIRLARGGLDEEERPYLDPLAKLVAARETLAGRAER